ncbi:MAG: MFS transporter [Eggerthellaceae bacterium]|nr:MFS transporter [Eggerthellaceae bacterium]
MDNKEWTISEVIDSFGINGHTWLMFVLLGLANIFDGYDFMIVNSTNSYLAASFGLIDYSTMTVNSAQMGSLTTWGLLGMVLGGAVGGAMSDRIGRKKMLIIAVIFYGLFTLPQAFSNSLGFFAVWRLIAGFGVGSCIPIVTTCFSETIPSQHRGVFVTFGMAFMVAGWVLAGLVSAPICTSPTSILGDFTGTEILLANGNTFYENWRLCYLIGALPIIYGIVLIFAMHETPHWYANSGQKEKAVEALAQIEKKHHNGQVTDRDPNLLVVPPKPANVGPNVLFSKKFIVATAAIWTCYFVGQFCVYGMNAWIPTWFQAMGYSAADSVNLQTWNNFAAILSNVSVGFVSDRIGRKKNLAASWIACVIAIILCSVFVQYDPTNANFILYVVLMLLFGFCLNYAITAVQPLMPESYPTAIRNTGVAWCQAFARFGGSGSSIVLGAFATAFTMENPALSNPDAVAAAAAAGKELAQTIPAWSTVVLTLIIPFALGFICTLLFVKETGGKTMDQLAAEASGDTGDTGTTLFAVMMVIVVLLAVLCIVLPLCPPDMFGGMPFSKTPMALPLMATGMLLPFLFFFIFAGPQAIKNRNA